MTNGRFIAHQWRCVWIRYWLSGSVPGVLDYLVSADRSKHQELVGNSRIPASISTSDLKGTELRSGHRHKTTERLRKRQANTGIMSERRNSQKINQRRILEPIAESRHPKIAKNLRDSAASGRPSLIREILSSAKEDRVQEITVTSLPSNC